METSPADLQADVVVIGLGPGGEALATGAANAGKRVVAIDRHLVGGECPYYGCIPTKMMVRAAGTLAETRYAGELAGEVTLTPDWTPVAHRISAEATTGWDDEIAVRRLQDAGAEVLHGVARLAGPGRVEVTTPDGEVRTIEADDVVLNTGTRPAAPPIPGLAGTPYWTNRDAVRASELPESLAIIGGGPIGCELAQVFARFGVAVTLIQHGPRLLPADEPEAANLLADVLADDGVRVLTSATTEGVDYAGGRFTLTVDGEEVPVDRLLIAAGRTPNLDDLGLETVGLDPHQRTLDVDDRMRVPGAPGLWAIGDITGHGAFTHVSMYQSAIALRGLLDAEGPAAAYHAVPHVTFTDPEVGGVGLTERAAREAGLNVRVGRADLGASSRGFTYGPGGRGLVTVVEDADRGVLVGACVVGPAGGEILGALAVAVHAGVPVDVLGTMIYAYPTFHRAIETAVGGLR